MDVEIKKIIQKKMRSKNRSKYEQMLISNFQMFLNGKKKKNISLMNNNKKYSSKLKNRSGMSQFKQN